MIRTIVGIHVALLAGVLVACGGSAVEPLGSGGAGSTGTGPSGSGTTESTATGTGGGTGNTTTSTGTGGACAAYADEAGVGTVTIHFKNDSPQTVYLPGTCSDVSYSLTSTSMTTEPTSPSYPVQGECLQTCGDLQTQPRYECDLCAPGAYVLAPGASRDVVWDGTGLLPGAAMPTECWATPESVGNCSRLVAAPTDTYRVNILGYSTCSQGEAACSCDNTGRCVGEATGLQAYADVATFAFPSANEVTVTFGFCAFGCAGE